MKKLNNRSKLTDCQNNRIIVRLIDYQNNRLLQPYCYVQNSWRTNLKLIRSIGNMRGYKKSPSEWQCLSEVKMGRGSPIPPMLRQKIVEQYQKGVSQRKIAKTFKLSSSTVHNVIQRFRESGTISVRKGQGRKTILDARDLQALRQHCITYRTATVMEITTWAQEYFQKTLSVNTIHRAIRRCWLTDTTSVAVTRNPSIGEGSVGGLTGSLSASGSHMDRLGAMRNNLSEIASSIALAGASVTGSLSGSAMVNYINRLKVQTDVQKERCCLSGESGTVSLGTVSDNASTKAMAGSILNAYMPLNRDGNSMEFQVDIESKPGKLRHHSGSSSIDDGSHVGRCGWTCPSNGCASEGKGTSTKWAKEASCSNSSGKKSKCKLRKKGAGTKINETREDMDAQLLEQRSTNSSEFDSPSLSGSLPSVADSHSSHFSEFSGSDLESMKTSCSQGSGGEDYHTRFATVSPLPEVENDRLETCPAAASSSSQGQGAFVTTYSPTSTSSSSQGPGAEMSPLCFITENVNLVCPAELDSHSNSGELLKEANNNHHQTPQAPPQPKITSIQTDI